MELANSDSGEISSSENCVDDLVTVKEASVYVPSVKKKNVKAIEFKDYNGEIDQCEPLLTVVNQTFVDEQQYESSSIEGESSDNSELLKIKGKL